MATALAYGLGSALCRFPHLGTFATADDAHDEAEVLNRKNGRTYYLHALLDDGTEVAHPHPATTGVRP